MSPTTNKQEQLLIFAIQHTKNDYYYSIEDFQAELNRIKYIKKVFSSYENQKEPSLSLFITHFVVLNNIFRTDAVVRMLFSEIPKNHWAMLKTVLQWLCFLPDEKYIKHCFEKKKINLNQIDINIELLKDLKKCVKISKAN